MIEIGEALGKIDGYGLNSVGIFRIKKEELFDEIKEKDKSILDECKEIIDKKGRVYTFEKDKKIKAIYLFEEEKENDNDNDRILKNVKTLYTKEIKKSLKNKMDNRIKEELKDEVISLDYKKIYVNDDIIQIDPKKSKKDVNMALLGGAALGFILGWIVFNDIVFGILYAIIFSGSFSGLEVVVSKKRGRKAKIKKKKKTK